MSVAACVYVHADVRIGPVGTPAQTDGNFSLLCPYLASVERLTVGLSSLSRSRWIHSLGSVECGLPLGFIDWSLYQETYGSLQLAGTAGGPNGDTQYRDVFFKKQFEYISTRTVEVSLSTQDGIMAMRWTRLDGSNGSTVQWTGGAVNQWTSLECPTGYVVSGFFGQHVPASSKISSIGVLCRPGE